MLAFHFKTTIALLILGFILGFFTPLVFKGCSEPVPIQNGTVVPAKDLKKQAEAIETKYHEKITELEARNTDLQKELASTKVQLTEAKQKMTSTENKIKKLVEPEGFAARDLLKKIHPPDLDSTNSNC